MANPGRFLHSALDMGRGPPNEQKEWLACEHGHILYFPASTKFRQIRKQSHHLLKSQLSQGSCPSYTNNSHDSLQKVTLKYFLYRGRTFLFMLTLLLQYASNGINDSSFS